MDSTGIAWGSSIQTIMVLPKPNTLDQISGRGGPLHAITPHAASTCRGSLLPWVGGLTAPPGRMYLQQYMRLSCIDV